MSTKSITIHGLSSELNKKIQKKSKEYILSQNKTVKKILEEALIENIDNRKNEFADLFGKWTKEDEDNFNKAMGDFDKIDAEDWK